MNIYYVAINKKDFYKKDFIFDVYSLVVKNLKPFSLERKTSNQNKQEMIYMLWKERVPLEIYKFICSDENFLYLNGKNVLYAKVSEIVAKFIEMDTENFALLRNTLWQFKNIFQYVYPSTYPDIYCATEQRGFNIKAHSTLFIRTIKIKTSNNISENPQNFAVERQNSFENEQKPAKIDDFNSDKCEKCERRV